MKSPQKIQKKSHLTLLSKRQNKRRMFSNFLAFSQFLKFLYQSCSCFFKAFTSDFQVHWGQHLLRPEFIESTYFLYRATLDPYYLQVGEKVLRSLQKHARVTCGYASIKVLLNITNCYLCYCTGYFFFLSLANLRLYNHATFLHSYISQVL